MAQALCVTDASISRPAFGDNEKLVIGWVEKVQLLPENILVHAKIDTGADNSSLNVDAIAKFFRRGESWVRFSFTPRFGREVTIERKIHRYAKIKRKAAEPQKRPVVLLGICLGGMYQRDMEVNLTDRQNFTYNMLIGRSVLKGGFLVDPSATYLREPDCTESDRH